jgi:hypothetical protein
MVAATRQKGGKFWNAAPGPAGGVNAPRATGAAKVIVVSGRVREDRLAQETGGSAAAATTVIPNRIVARNT